MKIVCIGSSLVNGFPVKRSECWVSRWRSASGHEIINKGVNGSTSLDMLSRFAQDVLSHKPDMVVMMSGTNDFLLKTSDPAKVAENFIAMCDQARMHDIIPVIATSIPVDVKMAAERWAVGAGFDYPQVREDLAMLRKLLMDHAARNGISLIDFYGIYMEELKKKDASDLYIDGIHPTAGGHRILADAVQL